MKKIIAILTAVLMLFAFVGCGKKSAEPETVGEQLLENFNGLMEENSDWTALELAEALVTDEFIPFAGAAVEVEPGLLTGFGNVEITGFQEGAMFAPVIGAIPFVGYVFTLEDGADIDVFIKTLKDNANLRWNICTEAEELVVDHVDNTVFFVMCRTSFEEEEVE